MPSISISSMPSLSPLVSIIIPTHNRAHWLPLAIQSALDQTHEAVEVIVVDDGSTDATPGVVSAFGDRIMYVRQDQAGVSRARNVGFAASKGEFVCFLDDDDTYLPGKISKQIALLRQRASAPMVHCRFFFMSEVGKQLHCSGLPPEHDTFGHLLLENFIWMSAPLIRRDAFERSGGFDEQLGIAADMDLWLRIARLGDVPAVQQPLGIYRVHGNSMLADVAKTEQECLAVLQRAFAGADWSAWLVRLRHEAECSWRLWFGGRHLALGNIGDFQRNFARAFACAPWLFDEDEWITHNISRLILDPRVADPLAYLVSLFDNLPASLKQKSSPISRLRNALDCIVRTNLTFRRLSPGGLGSATVAFADLMAEHPHLFRNPHPFEYALFHAAMAAPENPWTFVENVMAQLPPGSEPLLNVCRRVRHDVALWSGFEAFLGGDHVLAVEMLTPALVHRPSWLANRGIASALAKSLWRTRGTVVRRTLKQRVLHAH